MVPPNTVDDRYAEALLRIEASRANLDALLHLGDLELSTLPPEIGQLTALTTLFLRNNQFSSLPSEIGQLTTRAGAHRHA